MERGRENHRSTAGGAASRSSKHSGQCARHSGAELWCVVKVGTAGGAAKYGALSEAAEQNGSGAELWCVVKVGKTHCRRSEERRVRRR